MDDERKLKSYVWHGGKCFFVSTIMRDSSAAAAYGMRYAETMTWAYDWDENERRDLVDHTGDGDALTQHLRVVTDFYHYGKRKED